MLINNDTQLYIVFVSLPGLVLDIILSKRWAARIFTFWKTGAVTGRDTDDGPFTDRSAFLGNSLEALAAGICTSSWL